MSYKQCCKWNHIRPCGPVEGAPENEPICACGCSGYDERCGGSEWWGQSNPPTLQEIVEAFKNPVGMQ